MLKSEVASQEAIESTGLYHRIYLPKSWSRETSKQFPVIFMLHGRAGDASLMWVFSKVVGNLDPVVIAPQAPLLESEGAYSWWKITDSPARAREEDVRLALVNFERFVLAALSYYNLDADKVSAFGFSQGAALVGMLSLKSPRLFKAIGLLSGFIPEFAFESYSKGVQETAPAYFIFHGTKDEIIDFSLAQKTFHKLEQLGISAKFCQDEVAHKVSSSGIRALQEFFANGIDTYLSRPRARRLIPNTRS